MEVVCELADILCPGPWGTPLPLLLLFLPFETPEAPTATGRRLGARLELELELILTHNPDATKACEACRSWC